MIKYNQFVENCFFSLVHAGVIAEAKCMVKVSIGQEKQSGFYDLYLRVDEQRKIKEVRYKAYGNPYLLAGLEWLCQLLEDSLLDIPTAFDFERLQGALALPKTQQYIAFLIEAGYTSVIELMKKKLEYSDGR